MHDETRVSRDYGIPAIPLTVTCTMNGAETDGAVVAVMADDLAGLHTRAELAERVVELGRKREAAEDRYHALEFDYGTWHPEVMQARDVRELTRKQYQEGLRTYDATHPAPAAEEDDDAR